MSEQELWQVKLSEGCVIDMTLDEIDTAFNAGRIQASTLVMPPGDMRWTTLGKAAGLEEEAPYSIAPVAADIAPPPSSFGYPPAPDFDVDMQSLAESGDAYGLPKTRSGGKIVAVALALVFVVGAGVVGGAYAARPSDFKAKVAAIKAKVAARSGERAAAAAPPPLAVEPPPIARAPEPAPDPKPEPVPEPAATPTQAPQPAVATTSVESLPNATNAKNAKNAKKGVKATKKKK